MPRVMLYCIYEVLACGGTTVNNSNICKFNPSRSSDLICENFILETDNTQSVPVSAESYVMNIVVKGSGSLNVKGNTYALTEGTVFFVFRGETFTVTSDGELEYSYISFRGRRADEYAERLGINGTQRVYDGFCRLIPFWTDSINMCDDGNVDVLSEAVLLYSIAVLSPAKREADDIISAVTGLTHDNFTDPELSSASIAEMVGYSPKYLSSVFKKKMGIPYTEYLREMRIKHAVFLIENGVSSVKNVALLSGYRDALYFSKLFTKQVGISPKEYIKAHEIKD